MQCSEQSPARPVLATERQCFFRSSENGRPAEAEIIVLQFGARLCKRAFSPSESLLPEVTDCLQHCPNLASGVIYDHAE